MGTTKGEKTKMVPKVGTMNNTERDKNGTQKGYHEWRKNQDGTQNGYHKNGDNYSVVPKMGTTKNRNDRLVPKVGTINLAGKREWYPKWVP